MSSYRSAILNFRTVDLWRRNVISVTCCGFLLFQAFEANFMPCIYHRAGVELLSPLVVLHQPYALVCI